MSRYRFQAAGRSGGWFNIFNDTEGELQNAAILQLRAAGFGVPSVVVEADEWNAADRVLSNTFTYRLTATLDTDKPAGAALSDFAQVIERLTGNPATVSNLTAGDIGQWLPDSNPLPSLGTLNTTVALVLGLGVVLLIVFAKVK
jgi:hypothetical protein